MVERKGGPVIALPTSQKSESASGGGHKKMYDDFFTGFGVGLIQYLIPIL